MLKLFPLLVALCIASSSFAGPTGGTPLTPVSPGEYGVMKGMKYVAAMLDVMSNQTNWNTPSGHALSSHDLARTVAVKRMLVTMADNFLVLSQKGSLELSSDFRQALGRLVQNLRIAGRGDRFVNTADFTKLIRQITTEMKTRFVPDKMPELKDSMFKKVSPEAKMAHDAGVIETTKVYLESIVGLKLPRATTTVMNEDVVVEESELETTRRFTEPLKMHVTDQALSPTKDFWNGVRTVVEQYLSVTARAKFEVPKHLMVNTREGRAFFDRAQVFSVILNAAETKSDVQAVDFSEGGELVEEKVLLEVESSFDVRDKLRLLNNPVAACERILTVQRLEDIPVPRSQGLSLD